MSFLENAVQDLRFGARALAKSPTITAIAALSLALGIGANTAIFSLIDAVLIKTLPVRNPQELVLITDPGAHGVSMGTAGGERGNLSYGEYEHVRDSQQVFQSMYAAESEVGRMSATVDGAAGDVHPRLVSGTYFSVLGVNPVLGRTFTAADDRAAHQAPYAVISYNWWDKRFGRDAAVLGKVVTLGKASLTIIGVAPPGFFDDTVGQAPDLWVPIVMEPDLKPGNDWLHDDESQVTRVMWLQVMGRLKPGVTISQAQANISLVFQQLLASYHVSNLSEDQRHAQLDQKLKVHEGGKGANTLREDFAQPLVVLMTVVGLVLLIACANIANLLLARAAGRQKEIAIRLAMGASRFRLGLQLITESLMLAAIGGAVGVLLAGWAGKVLLRVVSSGSEVVPLDVHTDLRILAFTAALAVVTGVLFGLAPAFRAARVEVSSTLKENSRGVMSGGGRFGLGKILVVAQIAISLLLLIGAGLFVRTLQNLQKVQLGYAREKLVLIDLDSISAGYEGAAAADLYNRVLEEIRAIPGVKAATYSQNGLFSGSESGTTLYVEGYTPPKGTAGGRFDVVGPDYFSSLGIPMLRGRELGRQDTAAATHVCVINQSMAKEYFGGRDPIGKHIKDLYPGSNAQFEIVGVSQDVRDHNIRGDVGRRFYVPAMQGLPAVPQFVNYEIRTQADPGTVIPIVRRKIQAIDRSLPLGTPHTMDEQVGRQLLQERIIAQLSTFFGALALVLASVGLYGVLSYAVARRTNEIGIRIAIGAEQGTVVWMVLRETLVLVAAGAAIGIGASLGLARLVTSRMFGISTGDPMTMAAAAAVLTVVAMSAACFPALRASRVDPMVALRVE